YSPQRHLAQARGKDACRADAHLLVLQPDRARLCDHAEGHLPAGGRPIHRGRRRPGHQPAGRPAGDTQGRGRAGRRLVPHHHRRGVRVTGRALLSLAAAALCCAPAPAQEALRSYEIVGDAIPKSLTGEPGDPERGRDIVVKRESTCLLCHSGPFPEQRFQGDLSPNLRGTGARWWEGELRMRLVDASRLNPATIMPSYYRVDGLTRVAQNYRGKPVLTAEQIEEGVAYLKKLKE